MSEPRDWDADEREALEGLGDELAAIRRKHQDAPSLEMLRAAEADALPPDLKARVERHLQDSAWSRAVVDGLRETGADDRLDAPSEDRLLERIMRAAQATPRTPSRRWVPAIAIGGLALAATVLMAVMVPRPGRETAVAPNAAPAPPGVQPAIVDNAPIAKPDRFRLAYAKPDVKLSPSALAWRGDAAANPFLRELAPAFEAYRAGDYPRAVAVFDRLSAVYPESIEVLFYQGVSQMLAGNDAAAIGPLEAASRLRNTTFADDVAWYLAIAQQRSGTANARARLVALCRDPGVHAPAACAAVAQLDASSPAPGK
ncbi:MAG: hypothetical protein K2Y23_22365 [Cyanobacteria bacterium]|nr:hypothetical protein [Cyanobacteriota bacterium]